MTLSHAFPGRVDKAFGSGGPTIPRDIKSLITATNGVLRTLAGPEVQYSAAAGQVPDGNGGVQNSSIPPVGEHGYGADVAYTNLLPGGAEDITTWVIRGTATVTPNGDGSYRCSVAGAGNDFYKGLTISNPHTVSFSAKLVSGTAQLLLKDSTDIGGALLATLTEEYTLFSQVFTATGGPWFQSSDGSALVFDLKMPQVTNGPYLHAYIPPGQSVVSTVGTTTGNGVSVPLTSAGVEQVPSGVELVTNGTFDTSASWDEGAVPEIVISNGKMVFTNAGYGYGRAQTIAVNAGDRVLVSGNAATTSGSLEVWVGGKNDVAYTCVTSTDIVNGAFNKEFTIPSAPHFDGGVWLRSLSGATTGWFDNISVQKLIPLQSQADKSDALMACYRGEPDGVELSPGSYYLTNATAVGNVITLLGAGNEVSASPPSYVINTVAGTRYLARVSGVAGSLTANETVAIRGVNNVGTVTSGNMFDFEYEFVATADYNCIAIYGNASGTITIYQSSIQKLNPAVGTVAVLMRMGVGSGELGVSGETRNTLSVNGVDNTLMFYYEAVFNASFDGTNFTPLAGTFSRHEYHAKVVEFNGTKFRVGNRRFNEDGTAIDADIVWSQPDDNPLTWATFDGSFNPTTFLRWFLNSTVPNHMKCHFVSNQVGLGDTEIIRRLRKYGKF